MKAIDMARRCVQLGHPEEAEKAYGLALKQTESEPIDRMDGDSLPVSLFPTKLSLPGRFKARRPYSGFRRLKSAGTVITSVSNIRFSVMFILLSRSRRSSRVSFHP